jgi:hypothetical protein
MSPAEAPNRWQDSAPLLITAGVAVAYDNEAQPMGLLSRQRENFVGFCVRE